MPTRSTRYIKLRNRIDDLNKNLLYFLPPSPTLNATFTPQELDLTKAFMVLAHAEIEAYCEDVARDKATKSHSQFKTHGKIDSTVRHIVAYYTGSNVESWHKTRKPDPLFVDKAVDVFINRANSNNGVRRKDFEKLFYPLGVTEPRVNSTLIAEMDSFGRRRGAYAHEAIGAENPPDPNTERKKVGQIVSLLFDLDRLVDRLR